mmetsp:Transcript_26573/g.53332  ORF Transcript_26573/g.53332 Transcript_26573/m.53332 type:complete len:136 (-) Transcript_26573:3164-3571(-)
MLDKPYKTAVIQVEKKGRSLEMNNFRISQPEEFWFGSYDPSLLKDLNRKRLAKLPPECNTIFEYDLESDQFKGYTKPGKKCLISRNDKKTYLDSRIILGEDFYSSWDIGRNLVDDVQVWGATSGPFIFKKKKKEL